MNPVEVVITNNMIIGLDYKAIAEKFGISGPSASRCVRHFKSSDEVFRLWPRSLNRKTDGEVKVRKKQVREIPKEPKPVKVKVVKTKHVAIFLGKTKEYKPRVYYKQFVDAEFLLVDDELHIKIPGRTLVMELSSVPILVDIKRKPVKNIIEFSDHVVYCFSDVRFGRKDETPLYELRSVRKIHIEELNEIFEKIRV